MCHKNFAIAFYMYWFYFKGLNTEDARAVLKKELFQNFSNEQ